MRVSVWPFVFFVLALGFSNTSFSQDAVTHADTSTISALNVLALSDSTIGMVVIGDVKVKGYKKTKLYIIQREIPFKPNDSFPTSQLAEKLILCRQQLMNTSLFVDVEVKVAKREKELVFVDVTVKERWYLFPLPYFKLIDRNLNTWWVEHNRSLNRVNYGLKFSQYNVSGRNDKLNFWLIGGYTQQLSFRYENPFIDKSLKHGINIGVSYSRNREINYSTNLDKQSFIPNEFKLRGSEVFLTKNFNVSLGYSYRPAIKTRHYLRLGYNNQSVHDSVLRFNPNFFNNGANQAKFIDFNYTVQHYNVDYIPYPLKGFAGEARFYKRGLKAQNNVWEVSGRADYSFKVLPKTYLQLQAAGAIRVPFDQPYYTNRLFGNSELYLRGLEYYVIDGVAGGMGRVTAKREIISINVRNPIGTKTHDKIPFRVFLKGYGDLGYAYNRNPGNSYFANKWMYTRGIGIDILTFYDVVIKLEYSFNQLGERDLFVHSKSDF